MPAELRNSAFLGEDSSPPIFHKRSFDPTALSGELPLNTGEVPGFRGATGGFGLPRFLPRGCRAASRTHTHALIYLRTCTHTPKPVHLHSAKPWAACLVGGAEGAAGASPVPMLGPRGDSVSFSARHRPSSMPWGSRPSSCVIVLALRGREHGGSAGVSAEHSVRPSCAVSGCHTAVTPVLPVGAVSVKTFRSSNYASVGFLVLLVS